MMFEVSSTKTITKTKTIDAASELILQVVFLYCLSAGISLSYTPLHPAIPYNFESSLLCP